HVHVGGESDAEPAPDRRYRLARGLVAVVGELGRQRAGDLAPRRLRTAEGGFGALGGEPGRLVPERGAGGHGLQAAAVRAVALTRRPVHVDDHVAELGARPGGPAEDVSTEDEAAADAGPDG